ncbi:BnaA05g28730D [Brassica napus]|uniref:BnaA05g28730D protein n=2 Tax=Brassica TaxID=3705 RepID=A0A078I6I6_BRANA|nr:BnaA05g28730D [Brassica napus]
MVVNDLICTMSIDIISLMLRSENLANPTALLLSGVMMLRHLKLNKQAEQIHSAIINTIAEGKYRTADLGGTSTTTEFTKAICDHL